VTYSHRKIEDERRASHLRAFEQQLIRVTRITVLIAAIWTGGCALALAAVQVTSWLRNNEWDFYPLSSVLISPHSTAYRIASSSKVDTDRIDFNSILDWLLAVPAVVPLLIAFAALIAFWKRLLKIARTPTSGTSPKS